MLGIVLSPHGVTDRRLLDHRFVSIAYGDLVKQVRQRMGGHLGSHNTQYQYLLFDFLEQASRFARIKTMTDDQREFLDFWRKNKEKLSNIQLMREKIWHELDANRPRWSPESVPVLVSNSTTRLAAPNSSLNNPPVKNLSAKTR